MARKSAGILLYRKNNQKIEVFLAHIGGPFGKLYKRAWGIPKGEYDDEEPFQAARREFREEIGQEPPDSGKELASVTLMGGKTLRAWACEGTARSEGVTSNRVHVPIFGVSIPFSFPEIDSAEWFSLSVAKAKIDPYQTPLLFEFEQWIKDEKSDNS